MKGLCKLILISILLVLTGCEVNKNDQTLQGAIEVPEVDNKVKLVNPERDGDSREEYSYIEQLSDEKILKYEAFAIDEDISHLRSFSPKDIFLVYLHSIVKDDIEGIYSITYDGGELPDFESFKTMYYERLLTWNQEMVLDFRYFDSLETVKEEGMKSDEITVDMRVSIGTFTASIITGLNMEDGLWKMNILHLLHRESTQQKANGGAT